MKKQLKATLTFSVAVAIALQSLPAFACSFSSETYFTYPMHPDLPLNPYAAGKLGILQNGCARSYLFVAYRYLSAEPLSAEEQNQAVELWNSRLNSGDFSTYTDTGSWTKARDTVPGAAKIGEIFPNRSVSKEESYQVFCNCQGSAFLTAAKTLGEMIAKFGAGSEAVKDWLAAQDIVFSNCGNPLYSDNLPPAKIPAALPANADPVLQKNRVYQIAAANFYAQNYQAAAKEFEAIAADPSSRWKTISGYLAVRAIIREASFAKQLDTKLLSQAAEKVKKLIADPSYASLAADLEELRSYVAVRLTPTDHLQDLAKRKITQESVAEFTKTIDRLIEDDDSGERKDYAKLPESVKKPDLIDWIMTFQASDEAASKHSIEKWKQTHSLPWLLAAAAHVAEKDSNADAIIAECAKQESGPGHWSFFYYANKLNMKAGKGAKVRAELDKVLAKPPADLPDGSLNQLRTQRLALAQNLDEIIRFGVQNPLSTCSNGCTTGVPDDIADIVKTGKVTKDPPVFTAEAGKILNQKLPLSLLKQAAANKQLPADLRNNVAWTSWVRAILVGDNAAARELAQIMKPLNKARTKYVDAYLAAASPEASNFAATMMMLHFSSAQPTVSWGPESEDGYGDASGWWWGSPPITITSKQDGTEVEDIDPAFLTAAQKSELKMQMAKLLKVDTAPNYFGKIVFAYAKAHPQDPQVPEALHWFVKSTRYGVTDDASKTMSKQAFQLLHSKYKSSPWTKQTPYYY